jgi:hypothetical protein
LITTALNAKASADMKNLFNGKIIFPYSKPVDYIKNLLSFVKYTDNDIILDFFAGSGTTGNAVLELNKDGGNLKFILCQIDESIDAKNKKEAFDFCTNNNLPPVISSITIERLRRVGEKIKKEIEEKNANTREIFSENKKQIPDIGFKVFDTVEATKLVMEGEEQIEIFGNSEPNSIDRIYNMIFKVGLDNPALPPKEIVKNCMYCTEDAGNYYITNAAELDKSENKDFLADAIKSGDKIYIDGWTASINTTLQQYKEDITLIF